MDPSVLVVAQGLLERAVMALESAEARHTISPDPPSCRGGAKIPVLGCPWRGFFASQNRSSTLSPLNIGPVAFASCLRMTLSQ